MARVPVPSGYTSWNQYIEAMADASPDQSIEARRLIKRNIKLGMIASVERFAGGDTTSPSYRVNHIYDPLTSGHPWSSVTSDSGFQILLENGIDQLVAENNNELTTE
jgi:hypothetical protein